MATKDKGGGKEPGKSDLKKVTELHEGIPGYLDNAMASVPDGGDEKKGAKD